MDFRGQKLSEKIAQIVVALFAALAFSVGYIVQDFSLMLVIFASGVGVAFLITVLDWPMYNKHPVAWRRAALSGTERDGGQTKRPPKPPTLNFWSLFK